MKKNVLKGLNDFLKSFLLIFLFLGAGQVLAAPTFGNQSSSANLEWDFDFVETFDNLNDWKSDTSVQGNIDSIRFPEKFPILSDGSSSAWSYFSNWVSNNPNVKWIGEFGDNRVWRGQKSLSMDIGPTAKGPSRFGLHMGDGYEEVFIFFMVNIPKNQWPTSCEGNCAGGGVGIYEEGKPYTYFAGWKFFTPQIGCPNLQCYPYSPYWNFVSGILQYNYGVDPGLHFMNVDAEHIDDRWAKDGDMHLDDLVGDWFGVEYRLKSVDSTTTMDIWVYDKKGKSTKVLDSMTWPTPADALGKKWNNFFFGGNNSGSYKWGPTMESSYNIDDVIVDDKRIGPKYFSLIRGEILSPPNPPGNFSATPR